MELSKKIEKYNYQPRSGSDNLPEVIRLTKWTEPLTDYLGFELGTQYAEYFWLPILGPSVMWLLRRTDQILKVEPGGATISVAYLAAILGLGSTKGGSSLIERSIRRSLYFSVAKRIDDDTIAFKTKLAPLSPKQLERLPQTLQEAHARFHPKFDTSAYEKEERHAARLGRTLLQLGVDPSEVKEQLIKLKFNEQVAYKVANQLSVRPTTPPSATHR